MLPSSLLTRPTASLTVEFTGWLRPPTLSGGTDGTVTLGRFGSWAFCSELAALESRVGFEAVSFELAVLASAEEVESAASAVVWDTGWLRVVAPPAAPARSAVVADAVCVALEAITACTALPEPRAELGAPL